MIKGDRLIRKFKILLVLVTPDRSRSDGRKWSQTMERVFFFGVHFLFRFFPLCHLDFLETWTRCKQHIGMSTCLQRRVCHNLIYLFLIFICSVWHRGRCWSGTFLLSKFTSQALWGHKTHKLPSERKTAECNARLSGVMGERIDLGGRKKSIGMPFITILWSWAFTLWSLNWWLMEMETAVIPLILHFFQNNQSCYNLDLRVWRWGCIG